MTEAPAAFAAFRDLAAVLPEPHWLLRADGTILAANPAAAARVGRPAATLAGLDIATLVSDGPERVARYLAMCARSLAMVPGALTVRGADGVPTPYRCDGAVIRPHAPDSPAILLLRWRPREATASRFVALSERVDALNREIARREEAERVLRQQTELLEQTYDAMFVWALDGVIVYFNRAAEELYGWCRAQAIGSRIHDLFRSQAATSFDEMERTLRETGQWTGELLHRTRDGREIMVESRMVLLRNAGERPLVLETTRDVTESHRARGRREAAQRLEAVGRLAGGVAHEINNALQGALGFSAFALAGLAPNDPVRDDVEQALKASERAAAITHGLLAFSRRQVLQPSDVDCGVIVREFGPMLRQALGRDQPLELELPAAPLLVHADRGQLEQVLLNLVLNARDAVGTAGYISVSVASETLSHDQLAALGSPELAPGPYARLAVADTGHGMDSATLAHIFEPFYTTKPVGAGTGLGLPVVHGIVHQSGGAIAVRSAPGQGSTFSVYLPEVRTSPPPAEKIGEEIRGGAERVLIVDDEPIVLQIAARILQKEGYSVITAENGTTALRLVDDLARGAQSTRLPPVDLVLTDVIMPAMSGFELGATLARRYPEVPVLYTSGHPGQEIERQDSGGLDGTNFIQKPFQPEELLIRVRALLDRQPLS